MVNVEITDYPRSSNGLAKGRVTEVLGRPGDFGLDVEIIIRKYHIPFEFPEEVLAAARGVPQQLDPQELVYRQDFRGLPIVTIDGEDAKDFDLVVAIGAFHSDFLLAILHVAGAIHRLADACDRIADRLDGAAVLTAD